MSELTTEERILVCEAIHSCVDKDLAESLNQFLGKLRVTKSKVLATMAYLIASELLHERTEEDGCMLAESYGDYIHQTFHILHEYHRQEKVH